MRAIRLRVVDLFVFGSIGANSIKSATALLTGSSLIRAAFSISARRRVLWILPGTYEKGAPLDRIVDALFL